jgi:hypothetical protein
MGIFVILSLITTLILLDLFCGNMTRQPNRIERSS